MEKEKEVKKEVKKVEEEDVQFYDKKHKSVAQIIWDCIFWLLFAALAFVWIFDFITVKNGNSPKFCIKNNVYEFDDGTVNECVGLGYKVYNYNRSGLSIKVQFSPFFVGMETENGDK